MKRSVLTVQLVGGIVLAACSSSSGSGFADGGGTGPTTTPTQQDATTPVITPLPGSTGDGGSTVLGNGDGGSTGTTVGVDGGCNPTATEDFDKDGWSIADGDCNDCNKFINPGAYDIAGNGVDEDCSGKADDEPTGCDSTLTSVAPTSGADGATAMDLCRKTTAAPATAKERTWGVISADFVLPDGTSAPHADAAYAAEDMCTFASTSFALGTGILGPKFGASNSTQQGARMLGLSSGTARQPSDPGYQDVSGFDKCYDTGAPTGFPGQTPACPGITFGTAHDGAGLRVVIRVPTNAQTMSFDSNFFSYEFPDYVCSEFNDTFVAIMTPAPAGEPASANNNIAFDSKNNVISVNAGFLTVCDPNTVAGSTTYPCTEGASKLAGTGFGADSSGGSDHASTDWLTTTVNVAALAGKQITILFAVWDSSDGILDSTVLIDNVHWTFATAPTTPPPPVAPPTTSPK